MEPSRFARSAIIACAALFLSAVGLHATVTNVAWYRLGENDPGAANGLTVNSNAVDLLGLHPLTRAGVPQYTSATDPVPAGQLGSSLAVSFSGSNQSYSNAVFSTARNNFGLEAWVQPGTEKVGNLVIAYNGDATANGWGFYRNGTNYSGWINGATSVGLGTAVKNQWAHLALVRDTGTNTLYVNGVAVGSDTTATPATPSGAFCIGAAQAGPGIGNFWNGSIDEVRVFTFAAGQFTTNDLLLNQHRAQTLAATALAPASATLNGSCSSFGSPTTVWFEWGLDPNSGTQLTAPQALGSAFNTTNFSRSITGLTTPATYYFRAIASNNLGVAYGNYLSFTLVPIIVQTLPATLVQSNSATLNGTVNPNGTNASAWFQWGATTDYGNATPHDSLGVCTCTQAVTRALSGLTGGLLYHYRLVASNSFGMAAGADQTFWLPVTRPVLFLGGFVAGTNLQLTGTCPQVGNYVVVATTNLALPLSQWTPVANSYVAISNVNNFQTTLTNVFHTGPARQFFALYRPCAGTPSCGWHDGDVITWNQAAWGDVPTTTNVAGLLLNNYDTLYPGVFEVGIPGAGGFSMIFLAAQYLLDYLPADGTIGPLTADLLDPTSSVSGAFGGEVCALKINIDFSDAGLTLGTSGLRFGDLTLCGFDTLPALNGMKVREFLAMVKTLLGGGSGTYSITDLDPVTAQLNASFGGGGVSSFAQAHLVNGPCP
jgi:hypothetical protein